MGKSDKLNAAQLLAVNHKTGPALVVAGAGTGKTRVLVERLVKLHADGTPLDRILALTFTEKAAAEMADRVSDALNEYQTEIPIFTFNAYGESLLRRYSADIGLGRNFTLLGESSQIVFLRERLDELDLEYFAPVNRPDAMLGDLRDYFSRLKQQLVTPSQHLGQVKQLPASDAAEKLHKAKYLELASAYGTYIRLCREANVIDYDDQIYLLVELLDKRPNILKEVQELYDYIMIDEFQDTNHMQVGLVDRVAGRSANLLVVGDDDQSIYGWRGATLANILEFKDRYPKAAEITLTQNYRSTENILSAAYKLIQHNNPGRLEQRLGINKKLTAPRKGKLPTLKQFASLEEELGWIAKDIKSRVATGTQPSDIAVLARRNITIEQLHGYLDFEGVDHVLIGQKYELYHEPIVRTVLEALKAVVDPTDNLALYHTMTSPLCGVPVDLAGEWASHARRTHEPLEAVARSAKSAIGNQALQNIREWREKSPNLTVGQLVYEILDSSGYKDALYSHAQSDNTAAMAVNRLSELFTTLKQFEQVAVVPSAVQYVESLPALQAAGDIGEDNTLDLSNSLVNLLSIHKSKGLEWPIVYIVDCTEGSFPMRETFRGIKSLVDARVEADSHLAEERRLMYVAMTRAKDMLVLTNSNRHGTGAPRKPSRFLLEAFGENAINGSSDIGNSRHLPRQLTSPGPFELPDIPIPGHILQNGTLKLTVSQIQKYLDCPLDFFYRFVLNVPQPASPAQEYGNLMHDLLQDMNEALMTGKLPSLKSLQAKLDKSWPRHGHLSGNQRDRALKRAHETLKALYGRVQAQNRVPVAVEQAFKFSLPEAKLQISGRFDAVLRHGNGVEIVDYKTSTSVDSPEKAKQRATGSQQLAVYALAWQTMHGELPQLVTLDFIDTSLTGSVRKTQKGIDGLSQRLNDAAERLRNRDFSLGKDHRFCIHPNA